jgi:hypothetical protein
LKGSESFVRFANALQAGDERSRLYFLSKTDVMFKKMFLVYLIFLSFSCTAAVAQDANPLFVVSVNGKQGFIDKTGKVIWQPTK